MDPEIEQWFQLRNNIFPFESDDPILLNDPYLFCQLQVQVGYF